MAFNESLSVGHVNQATIADIGTTVVGTSSTQLLDANSDRKALFISNLHGTAVVYVNFGATASASAGLPINPNQTLVLDRVVMTAAVNVISTLASTNVFFIECID